jgi:hypothetical protein
MSFIIYHVASTHIYSAPSTGKQNYNTAGGAKNAIKRMNLNPDEFDVAEVGNFHGNIEKQERKRNFMTGEWFTQPVNTPRCCDPSTELYWSM